MTETLLEVRDLHTHFFLRRGVIKAVDGVSFSLRRGEVLGLVGESGCGKSLTALSVMRLLPKGGAQTVKGEVLLDGENILKRSPAEMREIRGRKISMVLQDPQTSLNPVFTIGDQLREAILRRRKAPRAEVMGEAVTALRRVEIAAPEQRIGQYPHQMSGGMKQRVVGAIAISGQPKVLIADEPTTALDVTIQLQYLKLLKRLQAETGMAILFITHDFGVVGRMCDRVAVMYAGRIVECGPVRQIFEAPAHPYTRALIASVPKMTGPIGRLTTIEGQPPSLMNLPVGCRFASRCPQVEQRCLDAYPASVRVGPEHTAECWKVGAGMSGEPLLKVEHVRKHFALTKGILFTKVLGHIKAVDDVSFEIPAGRTLGLVGESGCGKTTTSRMILNLETPTEGRILLDGEPIDGLRGDALRAYRARVQAVFQDPWSSLNPRMKVGRTVAESLIVNAWGDRGQIAERVRELLLQVGLRAEQADQYPHEFSGGQRQRVALAAALASRPQLIVLDEPVSALDVSIRAQMMNLLKDIQAQDNVAYLLVAHDLATVRHMADHTVVMYLGKIVEQAPTASLFAEVRHPYTRALFSAVLVAGAGQAAGEVELSGEVPSPLDPPPGCRFHTRCPYVMPQCAQVEPALREVSPGHQVACHLFE